MKNGLRRVLMFFLVFICLCTSVLPASAIKKEETRAIAIVFDNSGSMYLRGEQAWCRATYAMEVFAAMLNTGDVLSIHPMNPIMVGGNQYTMDSPLVITDVSQANQIREIYTEKAADTHIETIDAAANGLTAITADKKYIIVLTDGQVFYEGGKELSVADTKTKLSERFSKYISPNLNILYLGIGSQVAMPTVDSEYYLGEKASDSKDVLSTLTNMCNKIFARDTLPKSHISGNNIDFDISLSKLIVFVQGENVSDVQISGKGSPQGTLIGSAKTHFSDKGAGNYKNENESLIDTSLQGMLVTYADCPVGEYEISYSGNASNIEVYYEPDADLDFIFTDADGTIVDPKEALYSGEYKVQFGLRDVQTGELITSDLLGDPHYEGKYYINDEEYSFEHDGKSGEIPVTLNVGDAFTAELTASYLSGYSITKTSNDFGWPDGFLKVEARPVEVVLNVPQKYYVISKIDEGQTIRANIIANGEKLLPNEFDYLEFTVDGGGLDLTYTPLPEESAYEIKINSEGKLEEGKYTITANVSQTDQSGKVFTSKDSCKIEIGKIALWLKWLLILLILIILLVILWFVLHIKRLPTKLHTNKRDCVMNIGGEDVTKNAAFNASIDDDTLTVEAKYAGTKTGVRMNVQPGIDSYLMTKQAKRKAMVSAPSVKKFGAASIEDVSVGNRKYLLNEETYKLESAISGAKDFDLSNGNTVMYSGTMQLNGVSEDFYVKVKLNYKKK